MKRISLLIILIPLILVELVADPFGLMDDPIIGQLANSGVDVVYDGEYLWVATSKGLSGTNDNGQSWISYDSTNGLPTSEIAALASGMGQLWVATSYSVVSQGQAIPAGSGISHTADNGNTFELDTPFQTTDPGMIVYDMDLNDSVIYAACFYGGLIYSVDTGNTWQNLFVDTIAEKDFYDSTFFYLNNRFFSVDLDDGYQDTFVVWGGSAAGINQLQFIDRPGKLASNYITDISRYFDSDDSIGYTWIATDQGLSLSPDRGVSYRSFFVSDGLPADYLSAVEAWDGKIICAGYDPESDSSAGLAISEDMGQSWTSLEPSAAVGIGNKVTDISVTRILDGEGGYRIWAACSRGGLIYSDDDGQNWNEVTLDSQFTSSDSLFNQVYSVDPFSFIADSLLTDSCSETDSMFVFIGSGDGFWRLILDCPYEDIREAELIRLDTVFRSGRKVVDMDASLWIDTVDNEVDTTFEWSAASWRITPEGFESISISRDQGESWVSTAVDDSCYEVIYTRNICWAGNRSGFYRRTGGSDNWVEFTVIDTTTEVRRDTTVLSLMFNQDVDTTFWVGTIAGIGASPNAIGWDFDTVNLDPGIFDHNIRATSGDEGLTGNFVTALEVQYYDNKRYVWVAGNSTGLLGETNGINVSKDNGRTFEAVMKNVNCWNFAFNGADVYAATTHGLLKSSDFGESWDTISVVDTDDQTEIYPGTEYYGVAVVDDVIWAASNDGIGRGADNGTSWDVYRTFEEITESSEEEVYVSPLPSSPYSTPGGRVKFHYKFETDGNITIQVFDFSMDLVATPLEGEFRAGGVQHDNDTWDMRNDNGDIVATGPYYFKVASSTGGEKWGKIMVIP